MEPEHHQSKVNQRVQGNQNQTAGRDFVILSEGDHCRMESDKGIQCKACDWPVAHNASECMRCGYDYAGERAFEAEKARVQRQELFSTISISIIAVFCGALVLADKSGFGFQASLLILICGVAVLWLGLRYISIKIIAWLEERKK